MENPRLYLLRILLACIILNVIFSVEAKKKHKNHHIDIPPTTDDVHRSQKHQDHITKNMHKHAKKSKRSTYSRSWSAKEYNQMPPYLVFNRKVGAYYPYYTNHNANNIRRSMGRQNFRTYV